MSKQHWVEALTWITGDGTAVANTTTETIIFPNVTVPANYMQDGRALRLRAAGKLSTTGTPTITFALRWGGVSGTILAQTGAIANGSGVSNFNWDIDLVIQTRSNGATGTLFVIGVARVMTAEFTCVTQVFGVSGHDAPAAVTVDLTADTALALTADWSAADAANTLTGMLEVIESLN